MDKMHLTIFSLYPSAEWVEPVFILVVEPVFLSPCLTGTIVEQLAGTQNGDIRVFWARKMDVVASHGFMGTHD